MPMYGFECPECGHEMEEFRPIDKYDDPCLCDKCGTPSERLVGGCSTTQRDYVHPSELWSIAPTTPAEHRELVEVGATFNRDGCPLARNRHEKLCLLAAAGFAETK